MPAHPLGRAADRTRGCRQTPRRRNRDPSAGRWRHPRLVSPPPAPRDTVAPTRSWAGRTPRRSRRDTRPGCRSPHPGGSRLRRLELRKAPWATPERMARPRFPARGRNSGEVDDRSDGPSWARHGRKAAAYHHRPSLSSKTFTDSYSACRKGPSACRNVIRPRPEATAIEPHRRTRVSS